MQWHSKIISHFLSSSARLLINIWRSESMNFRVSPIPTKFVAPLGASPFAVYVRRLECLIVKFEEDMGDRVPLKERILRNDISMRNGSVVIFRGCQRNAWTETWASFGGTKGLAKGKLEVKFNRYNGSHSQDLVWRRRWRACQQLLSSPLPTGGPYSPKLRRTYLNKGRQR